MTILPSSKIKNTDLPSYDTSLNEVPENKERENKGESALIQPPKIDLSSSSKNLKNSGITEEKGASSETAQKIEPLAEKAAITPKVKPIINPMEKIKPYLADINKILKT